MRPRSSPVLLLACLTISSIARAQPPKAPQANTTSSAPSPKVQARAKADEAEKLFLQKKWPEAFDAFAEAEALVHAPLFVLYMARCQEAQGKFVEASQLYTRITAEPLPKGSPSAHITAQLEAAEALKLLTPRIPTLRIYLDGAAGRDVRLSLNGVSVSTIETLLVDPGKHEVTATWAEGQTITRTLELPSGKHEDLRIELPAPPPLPPPQLPPPPPPKSLARPSIPQTTIAHADTATPQEPPLLTPSKVPLLVLLGTGFVGLAVGTTSGILALKHQADVQARCVGRTCVREVKGPAEDAETYAAVSTVGFVTGGLASAASAIWIAFIRWPPKVDKPRRSGLVPVVGPNGIFVVGAF